MKENNIGFIGLGKMGSNFAVRLLEAGHRLTVYDKIDENTKILEKYGAKSAENLKGLCELLSENRIIFLCVPTGKIVDKILDEIIQYLIKDDIVIDLSNSFYRDSIRRSEYLLQKGINLIDAGVSGGLKGAKEGACIMIGGDYEIFKKVENLISVLSKSGSYKYLGPSGTGHLVKGYHNFIEYGFIQAVAEGLSALKKISDNSNIDLSLTDVCEIWNNGSIIQSQIVDYAKQALQNKEMLGKVSGSVYGQTIDEMEKLLKIAEDSGVKSFSCGAAIEARREYQKEPGFTGKLINAMRYIFGGHTDWKK